MLFLMGVIKALESLKGGEHILYQNPGNPCEWLSARFNSYSVNDSISTLELSATDFRTESSGDFMLQLGDMIDQFYPIPIDCLEEVKEASEDYEEFAQLLKKQEILLSGEFADIGLGSPIISDIIGYNGSLESGQIKVICGNYSPVGTIPEIR